MNEFDQFIKHSLKVKYYARYTDDFVIVSESESYLKQLLEPIKAFLKEKLKLELHPNKVTIRKYHHGIDFLGYVILPHHIKLRTKTKKRILKKLNHKINEYKSGLIDKPTLLASLSSYLGVLSHSDAYRLTEEIKNNFWFRLNE